MSSNDEIDNRENASGISKDEAVIAGCAESDKPTEDETKTKQAAAVAKAAKAAKAAKNKRKHDNKKARKAEAAAAKNLEAEKSLEEDQFLQSLIDMNRAIPKDMDDGGSLLTSKPVSNPVPLYEVKPTVAKGLGIFAIRSIKAGTEIFREAPLVQGVTTFLDWLSIEAGFKVLPEEKKEIFMALYSKCSCNENPCVEPAALKIFCSNYYIHLPDGVELVESDEDRIRNEATHFLFPVASRLNHSCRPNTCQSFTDDHHIVLEAAQDIASGEELTITYFNRGLCLDRNLRRIQIQRRFRFECLCTACFLDLRIRPVPQSKYGFRRESADKQKEAAMPVVGKLTPGEEALMEEVKAWAVEVCSDEKLLADSEELCNVVIDLGMQGKSREESLKAVEPEVFSRFVETLVKNDKYGIGEEIIASHTRRLVVPYLLEHWGRYYDRKFAKKDKAQSGGEAEEGAACG